MNILCKLLHKWESKNFSYDYTKERGLKTYTTYKCKRCGLEKIQIWSPRISWHNFSTVYNKGEL